MELHVGCAMWTYAPWQGRYLPVSLSPRERLRAYATWCNAVEGNTTFYATPALDTVRSWAAQTAPGFRFILKLPRTITHERRLAEADEPLHAFLTAIEPLGPRAHALWIQLPPSFSPADLGALVRFLRRLPPGHRYCVEVRHRAFFADPRSEDELERVLGEAGAEWVTFDTTVLFGSPPASDTEREAWRNKPRVPRRSRALTSHPVVRYIGRDDADRTVAGWEPWLGTVAGWLREGRSPTVFIHTPTTSPRSNWPAASTMRCEPGCPRSSRSPSRYPPDRRPCSEPGRSEPGPPSARRRSSPRCHRDGAHRRQLVLAPGLLRAAGQDERAGPLVPATRCIEPLRRGEHPVPGADRQCGRTVHDGQGDRVAGGAPARPADPPGGDRLPASTAASAHSAAYQGRQSPLYQARKSSGGVASRVTASAGRPEWSSTSASKNSPWWISANGTPGVTSASTTVSHSARPASSPRSPHTAAAAYGPRLRLPACGRPARSQPSRNRSPNAAVSSQSPASAVTTSSRAVARWPSSR